MALDLYIACMHLYPPSFDGTRYGLPRRDVEIEARGRGIDLSEFMLDKFAICESVIRDQDIARAAKKADAK